MTARTQVLLLAAACLLLAAACLATTITPPMDLWNPQRISATEAIRRAGSTLLLGGVQENGRLKAGYEVLLSRGPERRWATTGVDGVFEAYGLSPGIWRVQAARPGTRLTGWGGIEIRLGMAATAYFEVQPYGWREQAGELLDTLKNYWDAVTDPKGRRLVQKPSQGPSVTIIVD